MIQDFNKCAIIYGKDRISYTALKQRIALYTEVLPGGFSNVPKSSPAAKRRKVVIFSENRPGFIYSFFSIWNNGDIAIPVDAMSKAEELAYILKDCQPYAIWVSSAKSDVVKEAVQMVGLDIKILSINRYENLYLPVDAKEIDISYESEQTAIIIYTSGTTGAPKGVMLSFKNLLTNIRSVSEEVPIYTPDRRALILLPLHHVLPLQGTMIAPIILGAGVAISPSMAASDIMKTLQEGEVGLFIGVPRLWQSLYDGIMQKINANWVTRKLYQLCQKINSPKFSRFVFKKVHDTMGGKLQACPSGGAALDPAVWKGLNTLGLEIIEGYGMTECAPIITFSRPGDLKPGCVGQALPSCQVKIIDGEICAKGDNIMQGYYNRPEETSQVIDNEGWLHSGDLGYLDESGHLYITGRKKEMIVLPNGKNINPSELEAALELDTLRVKEAAVIEEDNKLKAILCPQPHWAMGKTLQELEKAIKQEVIDLYNKTAASYKKLSGVYVLQGELPRTRMDKIQRFKLRSIAESCRKVDDVQSKKIPGGEPQTEEYRLLADYIHREKRTDVHPSDNLTTDLGMDSLDVIDLECMIEQSFGVRLSQEEILSFDTIFLLSEYLASHRTMIHTASFNWQEELVMDTQKCEKPKMAVTGWWIARASKWVMDKYFRTTYHGLQNIPSSGNFIIVANHQCYLDSLFVVHGLNKKQLKNTCFFAKEDHVNTPFRRFMASKHCVLVLKRKEMKESIMKIGRALKAGSNVLIFPEGTRTTTGEMDDFRPTFAMLSITLGIPILPVCIKGAFEAMPKHSKVPTRGHVSVTYLPVVTPKMNENETKVAGNVKEIIEKCLVPSL